MKKTKIFIFSAISFLVAAIVSVVYLFNVQTLVQTKTVSNVYNQTSETASFINEYTKTNYVFFNNELINFDLDTPAKKQTFIRTHENYSVYGVAIYESDNSYEYVSKIGAKNSTFTFKEMSKNRTLSQSVSFLKEKYLFDNDSDVDLIMYNYTLQNKSVLVFQRMDSIINLFTTPYNGHESYYMFATYDGYILDTNYPSNGSITLSSVFKINDSISVPDFIKNVADKKTETVDLKEQADKKFYIASSDVVSNYNTDGIKVYSAVRTTYIKDVTNIVLYTTLVFVSVLVLLHLGYSIAVFINLARIKFKFGREGSFIKDENHYSLLLDANGKVISKNAKFSSLGLRTTGVLSRNLEILELSGEYENFPVLLKTRNQFTARTLDAEGKEIMINFLIIPNSYGYQILGSSEGDISANVVTVDAKSKPASSDGTSYEGEDIQALFKDDLYDTLNKKALYIELKKIIDSKAENNKNTYLFYFGNSNEAEVHRTYGSAIEEVLNATIISTVQKIFGQDVKIYNVDDCHFALFYDLKDTFQSLNKLIDQVNDAMKKPAIVFSNEIETQIDFGIYHFASFELVGLTPKKLIEKAALSFNHAVDLTNKTFKIYDANLEIAFAMDDIIASDIKHGLENKEFVTYFQPNYSLKDDRVSGFECLLRWNNDKYRNDSPFRYIQVAEKVGLINDIGYFTLIESFKLIKELNDPFLHISVNVSPAQFLQSGFIARLVSLYSLFEVPYEQICIEITETFLIQSMNEVIEKLKYLRSFGIKIYLDDFGTGYSSLLYLAELPVDVIKIDKAFITPLKTSKSSRTIVSELILIANELNIDIVAEGVEDDYQVNFLEKKKCNNIQGYYFSKPVSYDQAKEAVKIKREKKK